VNCWRPVLSKVSFLIVGAARSGTTSLCSYLAQHKDIFIPSKKELNFFSFQKNKMVFNGPSDYLANVNTIYNLKDYLKEFDTKNNIIGECSVSYLYYKNSACNIFKFSPNMKIILILRNPIERAFSSYNLLKKQGRENKNTFEEALQIEKERIKNGWEMMWHYKNVGLYYEQVKEYYKLFPKENIYIVNFDNFVTNPLGSINKIVEFFGLEIDKQIKTNYSVNSSNSVVFLKNERIKSLLKWLIPEHQIYKLKKISNKKNENISLMDSTKKDLIKFFYNDIKKLEKLTSLNFGEWYN
jgi:hypothetical protein